MADLLGSSLPQADPGLLREVARWYGRVGGSLRQLRDAVLRLESVVRANFSGSTADAVLGVLSNFVREQDYLGVAADSCDAWLYGLGPFAGVIATAAEYGGWSIIGQVAVLAAQAIVETAMAIFTFGTSLLNLSWQIILTREFVNAVLDMILRAIVNGVLNGVLSGGALAVLLDEIQVLQGHKSGIDWSGDVKPGVVYGTISGIVMAPLAIFDLGFGTLVRRVFGQDLTHVLSTALATELSAKLGPAIGHDAATRLGIDLGRGFALVSPQLMYGFAAHGPAWPLKSVVAVLTDRTVADLSRALTGLFDPTTVRSLATELINTLVTRWVTPVAARRDPALLAGLQDRLRTALATVVESTPATLRTDSTTVGVKPLISTEQATHQVLETLAVDMPATILSHLGPVHQSLTPALIGLGMGAATDGVGQSTSEGMFNFIVGDADGNHVFSTSFASLFTGAATGLAVRGAHHWVVDPLKLVVHRAIGGPIAVPVYPVLGRPVPSTHGPAPDRNGAVGTGDITTAPSKPANPDEPPVVDEKSTAYPDGPAVIGVDTPVQNQPPPPPEPPSTPPPPPGPSPVPAEIDVAPPPSGPPSTPPSAPGPPNPHTAHANPAVNNDRSHQPTHGKAGAGHVSNQHATVEPGAVAEKIQPALTIPEHRSTEIRIFTTQNGTPVLFHKGADSAGNAVYLAHTEHIAERFDFYRQFDPHGTPFVGYRRDGDSYVLTGDQEPGSRRWPTPDVTKSVVIGADGAMVNGVFRAPLPSPNEHAHVEVSKSDFAWLTMSIVADEGATAFTLDVCYGGEVVPEALGLLRDKGVLGAGPTGAMADVTMLDKAGTPRISHGLRDDPDGQPSRWRVMASGVDGGSPTLVHEPAMSSRTSSSHDVIATALESGGQPGTGRPFADSRRPADNGVRPVPVYRYDGASRLVIEDGRVSWQPLEPHEPHASTVTDALLAALEHGARHILTELGMPQEAPPHERAAWLHDRIAAYVVGDEIQLGDLATGLGIELTVLEETRPDDASASHDGVIGPYDPHVYNAGAAYRIVIIHADDGYLGLGRTSIPIRFAVHPEDGTIFALRNGVWRQLGQMLPSPRAFRGDRGFVGAVLSGLTDQAPWLLTRHGIPDDEEAALALLHARIFGTESTGQIDWLAYRAVTRLGIELIMLEDWTRSPNSGGFVAYSALAFNAYAPVRVIVFEGRFEVESGTGDTAIERGFVGVRTMDQAAITFQADSHHITITDSEPVDWESVALSETGRFGFIDALRHALVLAGREMVDDPSLATQRLEMPDSDMIRTVARAQHVELLILDMDAGRQGTGGIVRRFNDGAGIQIALVRDEAGYRALRPVRHQDEPATTTDHLPSISSSGLPGQETLPWHAEADPFLAMGGFGIEIGALYWFDPVLGQAEHVPSRTTLTLLGRSTAVDGDHSLIAALRSAIAETEATPMSSGEYTRAARLLANRSNELRNSQPDSVQTETAADRAALAETLGVRLTILDLRESNTDARTVTATTYNTQASAQLFLARSDAGYRAMRVTRGQGTTPTLTPPSFGEPSRQYRLNARTRRITSHSGATWELHRPPQHLDDFGFATALSTTVHASSAAAWAERSQRLNDMYSRDGGGQSMTWPMGEGDLRALAVQLDIALTVVDFTAGDTIIAVENGDDVAVRSVGTYNPNAAVAVLVVADMGGFYATSRVSTAATGPAELSYPPVRPTRSGLSTATDWRWPESSPTVADPASVFGFRWIDTTTGVVRDERGAVGQLGGVVFEHRRDAGLAVAAWRALHSVDPVHARQMRGLANVSAFMFRDVDQSLPVDQQLVRAYQTAAQSLDVTLVVLDERYNASFGDARGRQYVPIVFNLQSDQTQTPRSLLVIHFDGNSHHAVVPPPPPISRESRRVVANPTRSDYHFDPTTRSIIDGHGGRWRPLGSARPTGNDQGRMAAVLETLLVDDITPLADQPDAATLLGSTTVVTVDVRLETSGGASSSAAYVVGVAAVRDPERIAVVYVDDDGYRGTVRVRDDEVGGTGESGD